MFSISKTFKFSAAHQLVYLPPEHKCSRLHGHNYTVTVALRGENVDYRGFIVDYAELDIVKQFLDVNWDHRNLNEVLETGYTTAENLARTLYLNFKAFIPGLYSVEVKETDNTSAIYWEGV